jgi:putative DNA primase/helicase
MMLSEFITHFSRVEGTGKQYKACCPAHDDKTPSLAISQGDEGKILVHCHKGCTPESILFAVGLKQEDLFPTRTEAAKPLQVTPRVKGLSDISKGFSRNLGEAERGLLSSERCLSEAVVERYALGRDEWGCITIPIPQADVVHDIRHWVPPAKRKEGKPKIRSHGKGTGGAYLFPEDQLAHKELVLCEGELDALALISHGISAITLTSGATTALKPDVVKTLRGKKITLLMDNDDAGKDGAEKRLEALEPVADVAVAVWPEDRSEGWDATDELLAHGVESIKRIIKAAKRHSGVITLAEVESERVDWLWEGRIPLGYPTMIEGDPGEGKSYVTLALAADISQGRTLPCCSESQAPGNTLLVTTEDHLGNTIKPRLEQLGADMTRISACVERLILNEEGLQELGRRVRDNAIRMVVIDPITANLPSNVDMYKASDVRGVMAGLSRVAEASKCAIVVVRHLRKGSTDKALHRGLGSIDFAAAARSVLLVGHQASNPSRHAVVHIKSNLAAMSHSVGYEFRDGIFTWTGVSTLTAADLMAADVSVSDKLLEAREFLTQKLADGPSLATEIQRCAEMEGISLATLRRAKDTLGIAVDKTAMDGPWAWELPNTVDVKF